MQNKPLQIRTVHTSCGVTMCTNRNAFQIARTSGPGNNAICICDECLLEACKLRFGEVLTGEDAATLIINADNCMKSVGRFRAENKVLEEKIVLLEKQIAELTAIVDTFKPVIDEEEPPADVKPPVEEKPKVNKPPKPAAGKGAAKK